MVDIATLGIEVRSESLLNASQNLDRFAGVTQRVEQRLKGFSTGMTTMQGNVNRLSASLVNAGTMMTKFNNVLQIIGVSAAANEIRRYADSWTLMSNKIAAASQSSGMQARSLSDLKKGADNARSSIVEYADLYARIMRNSKGVAKSEQEVADATNIVSKAFAVGGAAASEQAAGVLQLGQALGSGVLQGDELRSIRENAPVLAQAIADEFGTTIAGLKDLGAQGKLTSERVLTAILKARQQIEAQFAKTSLTIEQSLTLVKNAATEYIGTMDGVTGASKAVSGTIKLVADNFDILGNTMVAAIGVSAARIFGRLASATGEQIKLTAAILEGNAVMLNSRTAALQKTTYIREAALADQQAAKATLDAANAERVRAVAALESAKAGQLAGLTHAQAAAQVVTANRAVSAAQVDLAAKTQIANRALLAQDVAVAKASVASRAMSGLGGLVSKGLNFVGGPVGAGIMAVSAAMYYSSKRAEEARQKSESLQKVWQELGYSAPLAAANIDKITSSIAQMSTGAQAAHLKDVHEEIERISSSYKASYFDNLPLVGRKKQSDEFAEILTKANKVKFESPVDAKNYEMLRSLLELISKYPTEVYKADDALKKLQNDNKNADLASAIEEATVAVDHYKKALNDDFMMGGTLGLDKAKQQLDNLKDRVERFQFSGLNGDQISQINALIDRLEKGEIKSEEFSSKLNQIKGIDAFGGLVHDLEAASNRFQFAQNKAEDFADVLERIKDKKINIGVSLTPYGANAKNLKDADNDLAQIDKNYEKLIEDANKTPEQKKKDEIRTRLLSGTKVLKDSDDIENKVETVYDYLKNAKNAEKASEQAEKAAQREANAYRDLIKSGQDRIGQMELEAQVAGKSGIAADTLRLKLELEQKATDKGRVITAAKREEIDKLVVAYQKAAEAAAKARLDQDMSYQWRQMGRSDIDKSVADTLKQYGLEENLNSIDAANIRLLETTKRNRQAWQQLGDTGEDTLYRLIAGTDDWRDSLASLMPTVKDLVLQLAGLSDSKYSLGGLLSNAFGGGQGNPILMSKYGGMTGLFAKGGTFTSSGQVKMFAKGSAFTNSIVTSPTPFRFADGDGFGKGIMGEAGPEAVMPLKRDARGTLGIAVNGSGRSAPAQPQQEQRDVVVSVEASDYFDVRVREIAQQVSQQNIREYHKNLPNVIGQTINEAQTKNRM